jgi:phosphatidylserine/phosphatidylglycerophosphate/cardiolipin synthase-like enzyme
MAILFSTEIMDAIKRELANATYSVQVITAYCKESSLRYLNSCIGNGVSDKRLLLRFRMDDVIMGSTDFSVLDYAISEGWKVHIRFDLHAKTYVIDNKRGLVGSANATHSGFSIGKVGNMEMATLVDIEPQDIIKIDKLFYDAIVVDELILEKLSKQMNQVQERAQETSYSWDSSITSLFNPHISTLFSYELPDKFTLEPEEYFSFLDVTYDGDREKLKEIFRWSNAYLWLKEILKENSECLYFGEITKKLHNVLVSDPKPYRRDVKLMLSNLLELIVALDMEEIIIDRPNYSQRVRLKRL